MARETLTSRQQYAAGVPDVMEALAKPHTETKGSRLRPLEYDVANRSGQDPFCFRYPGNPQHIAIVDTIATATEPRFPAIMEELGSDRRTLQVVNKAGQHLNDKKNIWLISPHGDILDIAYVLKIGGNLLDQQGFKPRRVVSVLSKALARVGFELEPGQPPIETVATMGMFCDDVFLTWPRTKSAKTGTGKLPKAEVDRHNEKASEAINEEFQKGSVLAAMAPTATTRMPADKRTGALILPTPSRGTLDLMMKPDTYVLPVTAWFKSEKAVVAFPTEPIAVTSEAKAHEMLQFMAEAMTEQVAEADFTYKTPLHFLGKAALGRR